MDNCQSDLWSSQKYIFKNKPVNCCLSASCWLQRLNRTWIPFRVNMFIWLKQAGKTKRRIKSGQMSEELTLKSIPAVPRLSLIRKRVAWRNSSYFLSLLLQVLVCWALKLQYMTLLWCPKIPIFSKLLIYWYMYHVVCRKHKKPVSNYKKCTA